jgi:hypothetical protein
MELMWARREVRYYRLGRHALLFGLRLLQIRLGDVVLMPEYICRDLLAPIHAVGAKPIFYAVDRQLRPIDLPLAQNVRAVLAVNYFGFPQDLELFHDYCLQNGAALIEDNAHGFLSHDATGVPLGERGDLGIFSLRKTFQLPDGAALSVNNPEWQSRIEAQLPCREESMPLGYCARHTLSKLQRRTGVPVMAMAQKTIRCIRRFRTGYEIPRPDPDSEHDMPASPAPHCRTLSMLSTMDLVAEVARRRALYEKMHDLLAEVGIEPIFGDLPKGVVPYGYPFYADRKEADSVNVISRGLGMDCIHWPDLPAAVEPVALAHYHSVWLVNFI